jgi:hypothetical protein
MNIKWLILVVLSVIISFNEIESNGDIVKSSKQIIQDYMQLFLDGLENDKPVTIVGKICYQQNSSANLAIFSENGLNNFIVVCQIQLKDPPYKFPIELIGQYVEVTGQVTRCSFNSSFNGGVGKKPRIVNMGVDADINKASYRIVKK